MTGRYPRIEPYDHGGPGSGCTPGLRREFDPAASAAG